MARILENSAFLVKDNQTTLFSHEVRHIHITVLGTGFSGLGMAIRLKLRGYTDFLVIERAADVGGNWRDNTYPGAACNVPSHLYSFSFAPDPDWSHKYPSQPEIRDYLHNCANRFGILPHIQGNTELLGASWNEDRQFWILNTTQGQFTTDIFISGNGQLDEPLFPSIPGLESFKGTLFHSARWKEQAPQAYPLLGIML